MTKSVNERNVEYDNSLSLNEPGKPFRRDAMGVIPHDDKIIVPTPKRSVAGQQ